jgi:hypothetical protein
MKWLLCRTGLLWQGCAADDDAVAVLQERLDQLHTHHENNMGHKDQLAIFVPAHIVIKLAQKCDLLPRSDFSLPSREVAAAQSARQLKRPRDP